MGENMEKIIDKLNSCLISKTDSIKFLDILSFIIQEGEKGNKYIKLSGDKAQNFQGQVIIENGQWFYKIYNIQPSVPDWDWQCYIRNIIVETYQENGLQWYIKTIKTENNSIFQIEKREKIRVIEPQDNISMEDIFVSWNFILKQIEKKLSLNKILKQLKQLDYQFSNVFRIRLIKESVDKTIDYGIKNGQVFLLDEDFFSLALVDQKGNWLIDKCIADLPVKISNKMFFLFGSKKVLDEKNIQHYKEPQSLWTLKTYKKQTLDTNNYLQKQKDSFLSRTLKLINNTKKQKKININSKEQTLESVYQQYRSFKDGRTLLQ